MPTPEMISDLCQPVRTESMMNLGWAEKNPELFVAAVRDFQEDHPSIKWDHRIDLTRPRYVTLIAERREVGLAEISVPVVIDLDKVTNAIVGALEGGYSPWVHSFKPFDQDVGRDDEEERMIWYARTAFWTKGGTATLLYDLDSEAEGAGNGNAVIGIDQIKRALSRMAKAAPRHFADLVAENDDAVTHDVFFQMLVFEEIVYG